MNEAESRDIEELERERTIMAWAIALKPLYESPAWDGLRALEASLANELAHTAMRVGDKTLDYWQGRYDGLRGLLAKVAEIQHVSDEIEARQAEEALGEKLRQAEQERRDRAKRHEPVDDGLVGE